MASVRFTDVQTRPTEFLDLTSLTLDEFQQLVPPFEAAFQAHMAAWRLDGKPRTARQFRVYRKFPPEPRGAMRYKIQKLKPFSLLLEFLFSGYNDPRGRQNPRESYLRCFQQLAR